MTEDIVDRLRKFADVESHPEGGKFLSFEEILEAATEIEYLRRRLLAEENVVDIYRVAADSRYVLLAEREQEIENLRYRNRQLKNTVLYLANSLAYAHNLADIEEDFDAVDRAEADANNKLFKEGKL
jgi:predicted esterase YcpF (UPF0227 family)